MKEHKTRLREPSACVCGTPSAPQMVCPGERSPLLRLTNMEFKFKLVLSFKQRPCIPTFLNITDFSFKPKR